MGHFDDDLRRRVTALEIMHQIDSDLSAELDVQKLIQKITDAATNAVGAEFGAFFHNVAELGQGNIYSLYTLSGASKDAFSKFPMPRYTPLFGPTLRGEQIIRCDDVTLDPRYGQNPPYRGLPPGHLPVRSYLAMPVVAKGDRVLGAMFFGHGRPGVFTDWSEQLLKSIAARAAVGVDNAQLHQRLAESEERLAVAMDATRLGMWDFNPQSRKLIWSERTREIYSLPPDVKETYDVFLQCIYPDDRSAVEAEIQAALQRQTGSSFCVEHRVNGFTPSNTRWVECRGNVIFDDSVPVRFIGTVLDITERKRAEAQQRSGEERLALFQRAAHLGGFDWVLDRGYAIISREYRDLLKLPAQTETLTRDEWLNLVYPDDRERVDSELAAMLSWERPYETEYRVVLPDGRIRWVSSRADVHRDDDGQPVRVVGVMLDITDRKEAEIALAESERMFRTMADNAPVMIWVANEVGEATFLSRSWYEFTGQTESEGRGFGWLDVVHSDDRGTAEKTFLEAQRARREFRLEYRLRRSDGAYRWAIDAAAPRFDESGAFRGHIGSVIDITNRKEAEERQRILMEEVDHRAKNVLAAVSSLLRLTRADSIESYVDTLEGRIAAMGRAHALLAEARWQSAPLRELVAQELDLIHDSSAGVATEGPPIVLTPECVQPVSLILHELTTNALKHGAFSASGGSLRVKWHISGQNAEIIWTEFNEKPFTAPTGNGFGMKLIELLVKGQLHGETEFAWSKKGLQFRLCLPEPLWKVNHAEPASGPRPVLREDMGEGGRGQKILIVEDDALIGCGFKHVLAESGYEVRGPAASIDEALALIEKEPPDAVLLDMNLNGVLSTPIAQRLQELGILFTYCTGYSDAGNVQAEHRVLVKPLTAAQLLIAVKKMVEKK